jgi:hypothetical protein
VADGEGADQIGRLALSPTPARLVRARPGHVGRALCGFSRAYQVRIVWHRWLDDESLRLASTAPRVVVIDPPLRDRGGERVPHLYPACFGGSRICCWDPATNDWDESKPIGEILIPFIEQWLCSYELWRVSGEWPAPGRHPERATECISQTLSTETSCPDRPARCTAAGFVRLGRLTGTFASLALMAVASEASYRWPRSRDWSGIAFEERPSQAASIWSPARPLGESSPLDFREA